MTMRDSMDDWQLLQAYARSRSEAAFAELVRLHLDWVFSVALRHVGDPHLAEDVVQSVFVLLARKARDLGPGTQVGGWLFRTTRLVAGHARRAEQRRKIREATACTMSHDTTAPDTDEILWEQLAPHLDQAVAALSETDRSAILLRFYEKMPLRSIGEKMGVSEDAAKKRVSRAVEKLREHLDRRGVKLSGVALAAVLAEKTVQTASAALAGAVVKVSLAAASASATTLLPQLARETLSAWHHYR
jgi:RNA polymerase sigma factor (sigma-70 family)